MLCAQLGLYMCVVQLGDEGVSPGLAGVHGDVVIVLTMPFPPLCVAASAKDHVRSEQLVFAGTSTVLGSASGKHNSRSCWQISSMLWKFKNIKSNSANDSVDKYHLL